MAGEKEGMQTLYASKIMLRDGALSPLPVLPWSDKLKDKETVNNSLFTRKI
jgi:hypothetical protein